MIWILVALLSALFTSFRHVYIKKYCSEVPSEILIFSTRLFGTLLYLPFLIGRPVAIQPVHLFWSVLGLTVIVTALATIVQIRVIQKHDISISVPYLSFIPLLMIPWSALLLKESPPPAAWLGLVFGSAGAWMIQQTGQPVQLNLKQLTSNVGLLMFGVAVALGLTTTCDKLAINASSAMVYAGLWTLVSTVVMFLFSLRHPFSLIKSALVSRHVLIQSVFWAGAFGCQMLGVQLVTVSSGVVYVKMLTMLHILFSVGFGGFYFKESYFLKRLIAAGLMMAGAGLTIWASYGLSGAGN